MELSPVIIYCLQLHLITQGIFLGARAEGEMSNIENSSQIYSRKWLWTRALIVLLICVVGTILVKESKGGYPDIISPILGVYLWVMGGGVAYFFHLVGCKSRKRLFEIWSFSCSVVFFFELVDIFQFSGRY